MGRLLKFAVVREDAGIEAELVKITGARQALVVASGGCTALGLAAQFPALEVSAFDFNPVQLAHVRARHAAALRGETSLLNVEDAREDGLSQCGEFERLFRVLRSMIVQLVTPDVFTPHFDSAYWPVAFSTAFSPQLLNAMFGPDATQHAVPGSYAGYFQAAFEAALTKPDARRNPFLQHILLGHYLRADAPAWISAPSTHAPQLIEGTLLDVPALSRFEVISLSNIFDWSSDALVAQWAQRLIAQTRPGTHVVIRQLNNRRPLRKFFEPAFAFDDGLAKRLLLSDRSFFYERLQIAVRV